MPRKRKYSRRRSSGSKKRWIKNPSGVGYTLISGATPRAPESMTYTEAARKAKRATQTAARKASAILYRTQQRNEKAATARLAKIQMLSESGGADTIFDTGGQGMYHIDGHGGYLTKLADAGMAGLSAGVAAGLHSLVGSGAYTIKNNKKVNYGTSSQVSGAAEAMIPSGIALANVDTGMITKAHRERIGYVYAPGDITHSTGSTFDVQEVILNPGLTSSFPWLSSTAKNYMKYSFKQLLFTTIPLLDNVTVATKDAPASVSGMILADYESDNHRDAPTSARDMRASYNHVEGTIHDGIRVGIECQVRPKNKLLGPENRHVRFEGKSPSRNPNDYDWGKFFVATEGIPKSLAGLRIAELWVSYSVQLFEPRTNIGTGKCVLQDCHAFDDSKPDSVPYEPTSLPPCGIGNLPVFEYLPKGGIVPYTDRVKLVNPGSLWPTMNPDEDARQFSSINNAIGAKIECIPQDDVEMQKLLFPMVPVDADTPEIDAATRLELLDEFISEAPETEGFGIPPFTTQAPSFRQNLPDAIERFLQAYPQEPRGTPLDAPLKPRDCPELTELMHYAKMMSFMKITFPANFTGDVEIVYHCRTNRVAVEAQYQMTGASTDQYHSSMPPASLSPDGLTNGNWGQAKWVAASPSVGSVVVFKNHGSKLTATCDILAQTRTQEYDTNTGTPLNRDVFDEGKLNVCSIEGGCEIIPPTTQSNAPGTINTSLLAAFIHPEVDPDNVVTFGEVGYSFRTRVRVHPAALGVDNTVYIGVPLARLKHCAVCKPVLDPVTQVPQRSETYPGVEFTTPNCFTESAPAVDFWNLHNPGSVPYGGVYSLTTFDGMDEDVVRSHLPPGMGTASERGNIFHNDAAFQSRILSATIRIALCNDLLDDVDRTAGFVARDGTLLAATNGQDGEPMVGLKCLDPVGLSAATAQRDQTIHLLTQILAAHSAVADADDGGDAGDP